MNLVCFSNNTGGGILCDLLNNKTPSMDGYKCTGAEHSLLKITDSPTISRTVDEPSWNRRLTQLLSRTNQNRWIGTHYHPSAISLEPFETVIAITTESRESKLYRWLRYYNGWFKIAESNWQETSNLDQIDKVRCLAKNVFETFESHPQCTNVEFADIVSGEFIYKNNLNKEHFAVWQQHNPWLYSDINTWAVDRFNEAEYEIINQTSFKYL